VLSATAAFLWALGELASTHAHAAKVQVLGANVANTFEEFAQAPPNEAAMVQFEALDGTDFDDAFLDTLQSHCEALRSELERAPDDATDHGALIAATLCANDARRVRGEYVPLSEDRVP
jgi:hypothetical protein